MYENGIPAEQYALLTNTLWTDWADPGPHPQPGASTTVQQNHNKALYDADKAVYDSQQNVKRALNEALNITVPKAFREPVGNCSNKSQI